MLRDFNKFLSRQQTIKVGGYNTSGTLLQGGVLEHAPPENCGIQKPGNPC